MRRLCRDNVNICTTSSLEDETSSSKLQGKHHEVLKTRLTRSKAQCLWQQRYSSRAAA